MSGIEPLTGTNFSTWRDQVKLTFGVMDLDHVFRIDPPAALTTESTTNQKRAYEQWERSNRMSLMIIRKSISVAIRGAIPDSENAKEYLSSVEEQFKRTSKAHASTLILKMLTTKYDGVSGVREHIMMMSDMANKLKGMDMEISEGFLVHFIMTSFPMKFGPFKINYNTQKEKWKMSKLIAMCVQEEERLKVEKPNVVHVATTNSNKRKVSWKGKGSSGDNSTPNKVQKTDASTSSFQGGPKCMFCHKKGHTQKDCLKFKEWLAKKGIPYNLEIGKKLTNGKGNDPKSFEDAITYDQSAHWKEAMKDELNSMSKTKVCELAELPKGAKPVGCKWVFKTKLDPNGNIKRYKARLVTKVYTQREGIDYKETFSPVSRKDSLRIVMALVAHFDLELHQMDIKTAFLNGDLHEDVYMAQPQVAPVIKGDVFRSHQCPKTEVEYKEMRRIPYASVVGSLMYAQLCTRPDIAYICGMLGRFQSNPGLLHWNAAKKVFRYLQGIKEYKLTYTRSDNLEVIGYSDSEFAKCKDTSRSTSRYIFILSGGPIS
uniref:UBN2_2 domain-containing protein n=1 Tax=Tanacetum cinerariifolium TaxID=118510 RepID=A0A699HFF8_TANCI|nr:UBN2_2 domain-containing protein [Tanacetum cinerariifolium]